MSTDSNMKALADALVQIEGEFYDIVSRLADQDDAGYETARKLRLPLEMVCCLRRLIADETPPTPGQIHRAFGAPGDFRYETPLGDALAKVYGVRS